MTNPSGLAGEPRGEPVDDEVRSASEPVRTAELTTSWRTASVATWVLVVFAYSAVWKVSVELGIGTWWLGARSSPQPVVIRLIPFAIAIALGLVSSSGSRWVPLINIAGAILLAVVAVPDFSRSVGLAVIELVIALAVLLVALASLTGVAKTPER